MPVTAAPTTPETPTGAAPARSTTAPRSSARRTRSPGQIVVILAMSIIVLCGMVALVIDVAWYWSSSLRVQRAADAAALAGVVWLPGNPTSAYSVAAAEATKNGFTNGTAGTVITTLKDPSNDRRLNVTITTPVQTFFMRVFGITSIPATRSSKAEFVLPVPMGSPQNYYGVGFYEGLTGGAAQTVGPRLPTSSLTSGSFAQFTNRTNAYTSNNVYATGTVGQTTTGQTQAYGTFGLSVTGTNTITGIVLRNSAQSGDAAVADPNTSPYAP